MEDSLGAGAIISALAGTATPEAEIAAAFRARVEPVLVECASGRELIGMGFEHDVRLAAQVDAGTVAPVLRNGLLEPR